MGYILLFVAATAVAPAQLGTYTNEQSCKNAIRAIYETRAVSPVVEYTKEQLAVINNVIDTQVKFQHEYKCVAK